MWPLVALFYHITSVATGTSAYIALSPTQLKCRVTRRPPPTFTSTSTTSLLSSAAAASNDDDDRSPPLSPSSSSSSSSPPRRRTPLLFARRRSQSSRRQQKSASIPLNSTSSPSFLIPSLFNSKDSRPIVLFDGKCNLCNAGVQLILDRDRADADARGNLRVAAMQSQVGRLLLQTLSEKQRSIVLGHNHSNANKKKRAEEEETKSEHDDDDDVEYKSIVVVAPTQTHLNSDACLRIGRELSGPWRRLSHLAGAIVPAFLRDVLYKLISRHRKRLFGTSTECRLWDDRWDTRFVDDAVITGRRSTATTLEEEKKNPFADPNNYSVVAESKDNVAASSSSSTRNNDDGDGHHVARTLLPLHAGDAVRVVMDSSSSTRSKPAVHTHIPGYSTNGICTVGSVGTVTRVLDGRAYPKNVAVKFELDVGGYCDTSNGTASASGGGDAEDVVEPKVPNTCSFEAHFFPWQLRKE